MKHRIISLVSKHSPYILAGVGCVGVIVTAVLASKATLKIDKISRERVLTKQDVIYSYIPTVASGLATISCIVASAVISDHRYKALAAAAACAAEGYHSYRKTVSEVAGAPSEQNIRDESVKNSMPEPANVAEMENKIAYEFGQKMLFYEPTLKLYFYSTLDQVHVAQLNLNQQFVHDGAACLDDFFRFAGVDIKDPRAEELGWSISYENEFDFIPVNVYAETTPSGKTCYVCGWIVDPWVGYMDGYYWDLDRA